MSAGHVREYVKRVASVDIENYPEWDLSKSLPRLPVPDLQATMDKYLAVMEPILPTEKYAHTKLIVEDFRKAGGVGEILQTKLKKLAETKDNWAYSWWLDDMYMKIRLPLPVNSNPGMVFPRQNFLCRNDQLRYASRLISGILDYKTIIDTRSLPIDRCRHKEKGQPLCMEQYYRLFNSYRVPGVKKDSLIANSNQLVPEPEHIIVICRNQFFVLDLIINFSRLSEDDMYTQLHRIAEMAEESEDTAEPIGVLTSGYRDRWAKTRMYLMQDSTNRDSLDTIERCMFVLCLDKSVPISFNHQNSIDETNMNIRDDVSLIVQMLHGQGSHRNSCNRWFDKTMQFIISEDGACGLNYEHSPSEGIAVVQLIEHLLQYMIHTTSSGSSHREEVRERRLARIPSICEIPYPRKLHWKISEPVLSEIAAAIVNIDRHIKTLDLYVLRFDHFGREFPKSQNMSPDSFIQLALQLTYYKVHGRLVSTYESASTRRFHLGRVDNIRANSPAALEWVKAMTGETPASDEEKMRLLRQAMQWQTEIMTQTILGHGMDCHLLGLKEVAVELGIPMPDLFTDEAFLVANSFTLSTSQVPTTMDDAFMCYGPVVSDGYGVCYNPHPHNIVVCVSSFINNPDSNSDHFAFSLESSFLQMHELCLKTNDSLRVVTSKGSSTAVARSDSTENGTESPRKVKLVRQKNTNCVSTSK